MPTDASLPLADFAIALFIGALVGLEREKRVEEDIEKGLRKQRGIGGLRTFLLFAQAGAVGAWLSVQLGTPWVFVGAGAMVTALVMAGYAATWRSEGGQLGLTTEVAAIVTYLLGGTVLFGYAEIAVALAIATSAALAFKQPLHRLVQRVGRDDLYAALKLLIAAFIVLPVLPDRPIDPWGALNPWRMGWLVVLISGLSLVGYVATRLLGSGHGIPLTGLVGGLVSSTAVTLSLARRSVEDAGSVRLGHELASGILLSWATMFARIGVVVTVVNAPLARHVVVPMAALFATAAGAAAWHHRQGRAAEGRAEPVPLSNPFSLSSAIRFAALFAAVLLAVRLVEVYLPQSGLYAVAALAGLTDVDAITLSVAAPGRDLAAGAAAAAIGVAAASNTIVKCALVAVIGSGTLRRHVLVATGALLAAGAVALAAAA